MMKKTIMRINRIIVMCLVATCLLASCKKENGTEGNVPEGGFVANIEQNGGDSNSRTHINPDSWKVGSHVGVFWTKDDLIKVANGNGTTLTYQLTEGEDTKRGTFYTGLPHQGFFQPNYVAIYPAKNAMDTDNTISGNSATFHLPATQTYKEKSFAEKSMPMVAYSTTQTLQFKNVLGCICLSLVGNNMTVTKIVLTSKNTSDKLWGTCTTNISTSGGDPSSAIANSDPNKHIITLDCGGSVSLHPVNPTYFCIIVPPGTLASGFTVEMYNGSTKLNEASTTTNANIRRNVISKTGKITVSEPEPEPVFTEKQFSVASNRTVYFSPGNLQYKNGTGWRFAENQWDYVGGWSTSNWIDLFGWGTSGWNSGGHNTNYQPTATYQPTTPNDLVSVYNWYGYGPDVSTSGGNSLIGSYDRSDWGVYNAIYNPKTNHTDAAGTWRTLTNAEWNHLFTGRANAAQKYGYATVGGKKGIIILPDSFTDPKKNNGSGAFVGSNGGNGYTRNVYTADNWRYMEAAGAIFLPAAGSRSGTSVSGADSNGYYWSTTVDSPWNGYGYVSQNAYCLSFASTTCTPSSSAERYRGYSVRLVHQ